MNSHANESNSTSIDRRNFLKSIIGGAALASFSAHELNAAIYKKLSLLGEQYIYEESPDGAFWDYVADQYMFKPGLILMNNGTIGPMARPVFNMLMHFFKIQCTDPIKVFPGFFPYIEETRQKLAPFIKASPDEIALLQNSTQGMNFVTKGLDMKPGDEVLMSSLEHPAGIEPWKIKAKRRGIKIKEVRLNTPPKNKDEILNGFNDAINPNTRIIHISHVVYKNGLVTPLKEISALAHDKNVLVVADGAHSLGMIDLDMHELGADFYAASAYKWANAPIGSGFFYVKKDVQEELWPTVVAGGWDHVEGARRYENLGTAAYPVQIAFKEALTFLTNIGMKRVERRIKTLAAYLKREAAKIPGIRIYTPTDPTLSGGLTSLSLDGVTVEYLMNYVMEKYHIIIRTITFHGIKAVRISTPVWISHKHVDMLLEGFQELSRKRGSAELMREQKKLQRKTLPFYIDEKFC
jgi:selenocysteine lyase/cysteine desulfurase